MDLDALLQPIAGADAGGEDLSFSDEFDAIAEARREEDASLPMGEWKEKGKDPKVADWPAVSDLCQRLLRTRSKDLRLVGWLADAWARQRGLAGLRDGLRLGTALVEQQWDQLHPRPEGEDMEQRVGALNWLLGRVPALVRIFRTDGGQPPVHGISLPALKRADAAAALAALGQLQAAVDARLGAEGPGFVNARDALKALVTDLPVEEGGSGLADADSSAAEAGTGQPAGAAAAGGPLQNRTQALQQLRQVAEFFRRTEPHSPVAYLADKAARWGAMDLQSWLRTVVKDQGSLMQLEELLGIEPPQQT
jgi:type VI secretion system protein ImpA